MSKEILFKAIVDGLTDYAMFTVDIEARLLDWNASAQQILGLTASQHGSSASQLFTFQDQTLHVLENELAQALATGRAAGYRRQKRVDGSTFWAESVVTPIHDESQCHLGFLIILRDVTSRRAVEEQILHAAKTDPLTGLANRASFHEHLNEWTAAGARAGQSFILHLLDLDNFKEVNDTLGHQAGDLLLYKVGRVILSVTRETDFVARLGGDEFAVLQAGVMSAVDGGRLEQKMLVAIGRNFDLDGCEAHITPSIGIAVAPQDGSTADGLLKKADAALYRVKQEGRNGFSYFTKDLDTEAHDRAQDLNALRQSVDEKSFHLVYQPKVSAHDAHLVAVEALLRCEHPRLVGKPVGNVIALATHCGVMPKISEWVIDEACRQMKLWLDSGLPRFAVCVNLCAREVSSDQTAKTLVDIVHLHGLSPKDLVLEITERELFNSGQDGIDVLQGMSDAGFGIAIDDFGTGYSSISYLTTLPIDLIKLDMCFAHGIPDNNKSCIAVKGIINLATSLGIKVVAEGIEREEQFDFFRNSGCEAMQGYYFSRPLRADNMTIWMQQHCL